MSQVDFYVEELKAVRKVNPNHPVLRVEPAFLNVCKGALEQLSSGGAWMAGAGSFVHVTRRLLKGDSIENGQHHVRQGETLTEYARYELASHKRKTKDSFIAPVSESLLTLVHMYETQGLQHTSDEIADTMLRLFENKPLLPLQGTDDEWVNVSEMSRGAQEPHIMYQNKRCAAAFKDSDGTAWYLDGIVCVNEKDPDDRYHTSSLIIPDGRTLRLRALIKSFPFTPKSFELKVRHLEYPKDWWTTYLDDLSRLDPIYEYYNLESPYYEEPKTPK